MQNSNSKAKVILTLEAGQAKLAGELNFDNVLTIRQTGLDYLTKASSANFDFAQLKKADSAGVALLLEWWRAATLQKKQLRFTNLPEGMQALINVSSLDEVIGSCCS